LEDFEIRRGDDMLGEAGDTCPAARVILGDAGEKLGGAACHGHARRTGADGRRCRGGLFWSELKAVADAEEAAGRVVKDRFGIESRLVTRIA
jgi:hypothetical protein